MIIPFLLKQSGKFHLTLLFIFILSSQSILSQVNIQIRIKQAITKHAKISYYQGRNLIPIDSVHEVSPGFFRFKLPQEYNQGLYKLSLGKNIGFDFIVASEPNISLETVVFAAEDSLKSIDSKENSIYFKYRKYKKIRSQQIWHINSLLDYYSDSSNFKKNLYSELYLIKSELRESSIKIASENPGLFVSTLIRFGLKPNPQIGFDTIKQRKYEIQNWWSEVNINDDRVIRIPEFDKKLWDYFELLFDDRFDKEQQDSAFIEGAKTIMNLCSNKKVKEYLRTTLLRGFIENEYDIAAAYMSTAKFDDLTMGDSSFNSYLRYSNRIGVGSKVKDFKIKPPKGSNIYLSSIKSNYILLLFWSQWCPHCIEILPELTTIYNSYKSKGFEIVAVSIDNKERDWKEFLNERQFDWINTIEPDNVDNLIINQFNVDETPKLYLIDKNLNIVSCPLSSNQLNAKLKKLIK